MSIVVYIDESGDHSLTNVNRDYPIFVLVFCIVERQHYIHELVPHAHRLKFEYFGHEGVPLHSYEIRKAKNAFAILRDSETRSSFLGRVSQFMRDTEYRLIAVAIRKQEHIDRYARKARDPYELAFSWAIERLIPLLEERSQSQIHLVAEERGETEDANLRSSFERFLKNGNFYTPARRLENFQFDLCFIPKRANMVGHQIADLAGYSIGRHILRNPDYNVAGDQTYEIVRTKYYVGPRNVRGLKVFP